MKLGKIKFKTTKYFYLYFIISILFFVCFFFLIPAWSNTDVPWNNLGNDILHYILGGLLIIIIGIYFSKKFFQKSNEVLFVLRCIEIAIFIFLIVLCFIPPLRNILGGYMSVERILGYCIVTDSIVGLINGYYYGSKEENHYPMFRYVFDILFMGFGFYLIFEKVFISNFILWVFDIGTLLLGVIFFIEGILCKPKKEKPQIIETETK